MYLQTTDIVQPSSWYWPSTFGFSALQVIIFPSSSVVGVNIKVLTVLFLLSLTSSWK